MITKQSARNKGKSWEREIAELLTSITGAKWRRTPCSGAIRHYFDGDIMKTDKKPTIIDDCLIECKNHKTLKIPDWIKRTEEEAKDANTNKWLLFFKHKGKGFVAMPIDYFSKLLKSKENV